MVGWVGGGMEIWRVMLISAISVVEVQVQVKVEIGNMAKPSQLS